MFTHVYYNSILYTVTVKLISIGSRPEEFAKIFLARFLIIFFIIFTILYICLHVYIIILFYIQSVNINWILNQFVLNPYWRSSNLSLA